MREIACAIIAGSTGSAPEAGSVICCVFLLLVVERTGNDDGFDDGFAFVAMRAASLSRNRKESA